MKIIHSADIHLGSKMDSAFPKDISDERKREVRATFSRLIDYARENSIKVILLPGDIFDSDKPLKADKDFFYSAVKNNPEIDFLYLRGNHDVSQNILAHDIPNLKTFTGEWTTYRYGNLTITGAELNMTSPSSLYSSLNLDEETTNIVMLHGTVGGEGSGGIDLAKLRDKNIDYLALGHLHSYRQGRIDERGLYAYSGCLEGRGFDETGTKGFILLEASKGVKTEFVPFAKREICETEIDLTSATDEYTAVEMVKSVFPAPSPKIERITLVGEVGFDGDRLKEFIKEVIKDRFYFVTVKDKTLPKLDIEKLKSDNSLKGEFVREVLSNPEYSKEEKVEIIKYGLKSF